MTDDKKAAMLAEKIMNSSRTDLLLSLRFMNTAIYRLDLCSGETSLATDGRFIFYGAEYVIQRYKQESTQLTRDILHMVFHCIFHHPFVNPNIDTNLWDLAADIAVENLIGNLDLSCVETKGVQRQRTILHDLENSLKLMNAEHIYRYFKEQDLSENQIAYLRKIFLSDDHTIWYNTADQNYTGGNDSASNSAVNSQAAGENGRNEENSANEFKHYDKNDEIKKGWERVSKQIQLDLESFSKEKGLRFGKMKKQLGVLNREKYDYSKFLKHFAVMGETLKVNDDEFDYIFYTYGLNLFGNVPIIEPLEYKEEKRIRDFVVAIDTSGSTEDYLVKRFLEKTYNILKNTNSFFSKINLHIIQCDAIVQENVKITSQTELDEYIKTFQIRGLGGTDFRPAFEEVNRMVENKEFTHLKGMIYFTDGYGTFPSKKPDYETAFVFIREEYENPSVPPWAIKLILNDEEI